MPGLFGMRKFVFRGGPMHGRELEVPDIPERCEWWITTIDGLYIDEVGKISFEMLEDPNRRQDERYVRVGDEFVHETLIAPQQEPPTH
jgi:hypothetical protein